MSSCVSSVPLPRCSLLAQQDPNQSPRLAYQEFPDVPSLPVTQALSHLSEAPIEHARGRGFACHGELEGTYIRFQPGATPAIRMDHDGNSVEEIGIGL